MKNLPICGDSVKLLDNLKEAAFTYLGINQGFYNKNCDQDWNFGIGLFPIRQNFEMRETNFWWHAKNANNLNGPSFTYFAKIKGSLTKIVTKTDILAMVHLLWGTNFICYKPIFGDNSLFHIWHNRLRPIPYYLWL